MDKYDRRTHYTVVFCGLVLLGVGIATPLRFPSFDTVVFGVLVGIIGLATIILFGPKGVWTPEEKKG